MTIRVSGGATTKCLAFCILSLLFTGFGFSGDSERIEYRVLATKKTSTMEKELNEAGAGGFRFAGVMGGETAAGGSEVVTVMSRTPGPETPRYQYKLLATNRTGTMQKEMQQAADAGYEYRGQSVFSSTFGGREVVVIMERNDSEPSRPHEYRLLATARTSTMQKELAEVGDLGFELVGMTVAETAMGGKELVVITSRRR